MQRRERDSALGTGRTKQGERKGIRGGGGMPDPFADKSWCPRTGGVDTGAGAGGGAVEENPLTPGSVHNATISRNFFQRKRPRRRPTTLFCGYAAT